MYCTCDSLATLRRRKRHLSRIATRLPQTPSLVLAHIIFRKGKEVNRGLLKREVEVRGAGEKAWDVEKGEAVEKREEAVEKEGVVV